MTTSTTRPRNRKDVPAAALVGLWSNPEPLVWGRRPVPLLPSGLRTLWAHEALPVWVAAELDLPEGSTFAALGRSVWNSSKTGRISNKLRAFFKARIGFRVSELRSVRLLEAPWPRELDPRGFPWSPRLRSALSHAGLLNQPVRLSQATASDLMRVRKMGEISVLGFAGVAELVLDDANRGGGLERPKGIAREPDTWTREVHGQDPRFRQLLPATTGTLADYVAQLRLKRLHLQSEVRQFRSSRTLVRQRLDAIQAMSLESALLDLVQATSGLDRSVVVTVARRLGLDGEAPRRHANFAATNERFRRFDQQFLRNLPKVPLYLPQLDEALGLLASLAPCHISDASELLRARGLGRGTRNVEMVLTAGRLFGRHVSVALNTTGQFLVRRESV